MSATGADGDGRDATIARLRALAAPGVDPASLAPPAPHPDATLLDVLAHAMWCQKETGRLARAVDAAIATRRSGLVLHSATQAQQAELDALMREQFERMEDARKALRQAGKMPARTGAGIYAKVLAARASGSGSPGLCRSIADDLAALPALRALLWPADCVS